jgi:hypothetical protein
MLSARYSCQILMELEFSRQIFEKQSNIKFHKNLPRESIKFHENLPRESQVVPCSHDEANSRYSQF